VIWQSLAPDAVTNTRAPGDAVTVLLVLPSADRTVTDNPPLPLELVETLPFPAVTLDVIPPALELLESPPPLPLVEWFSTLQPPPLLDDELAAPLPADVVTLDELCAPAAPAAISNAAQVKMKRRAMTNPLNTNPSAAPVRCGVPRLLGVAEATWANVN
jgi:hypothetical protein